jgi:hypothetical protein
MDNSIRKECLDCDTHTFGSHCGNCGSGALRPVMPSRFERKKARESLQSLLRTGHRGAAARPLARPS